MRSLVLFMYLVATVGVAAQVRSDITMNVDGVDRSVIVSRPSASAPGAGYPLVMVFHGTSGDGDRFYNISGWKEKGEQEGFVTVFPSALEYCVEEDGERKRTTKWNNGDLQSVACEGQTLMSDIAFVRAMIDTVSELLPIDASRIYASGFSNGGVMTAKLAVEMSDVFAAINVAAGTLHPLDSAEPLRNIPIAATLGSRDDRALEAYGIADEFSMDVDTGYATIGGMMRRFTGPFGLTNDYTSTVTPRTTSWRFTTPRSGETVTEFIFTLIDDLPHQYPNGVNYPISAPNVLWEFFSRYALTSRVDAGRAGRPAITLAPNPASGHLRIGGAGVSRIVLRSVLGDVAFVADVAHGYVALPSLPAGLYVAEIHAGNLTAVRTVIIR